MILLFTILTALALLFFFFLGKLVDGRINACGYAGTAAVSEKAKSLHAKLLIADMHADSFLWDRNFLERNHRGHIDLPRMLEGNAALQIFDAVTQTPRGLNYDRNDDRTDNITLLTIANRRPLSAWNSLKERALHHAALVHKTSADSQGQFSVITNRKELDSFLEKRQQTPNMAAGMLAVEGLHALEGRLENLDVLHHAGYRMMGLVHFFDNDAGGSSTGMQKGGLTDFGKAAVRKMEELHIVVDLAHASEQLIDDVLAFSHKPVVVSHTGLRGTKDSLRNLSDAHLKAVAEKGGLIGIGYWSEAVGDITPGGIAKTIRYAVNRVGVEHIALGSDFDGAVATQFDVSALALLTDALLQEDFNEDEIAQIMGGNQIRFLQQWLPA
ncbi:MAG: membrane dipeptidase [Chitinophagales bacterium]